MKLYRTRFSGYYLYLIGAKQYDQEDDDWAAGYGDYKPEDAYLGLPETEFKNVAWERVQEVVIKKVKGFIKSEVFKLSFFNNAKALLLALMTVILSG
ncbi:MAG TPA: hypothetical protein VJU78_04450 [Chitinophagaceae bacterium]|nr:hypothetical protein [Chitinophagaceae bacterium]